MNRFLNYDNPALQFIGKILDATILHLCWLLCSLPIVTLGASTTALYYALMNDVTDEDGRYIHCFFQSFRNNFWIGLRLSLILLLAASLLVLSVYSLQKMEVSGLWVIVRGIDLIFALCFIFALQYMFVLLGFFHTSIGNLIQTSLFLAIRHFWRTLLMVLIPVFMSAMMYYFKFYALMLPGFGLVVYLDCYILKPVIMPWIRKARGEEEDPEMTENASKPFGSKYEI